MTPGATTGGSPLEQYVRSAVAAHRADRGALLPILHDIQATFGYVDPAVVPILADELNLSRADVHGVISFYHDFRKSPAAGTHVRVCRAEACQAAGAEQLVAHVKDRLHTDIGGTSPDRGTTLDQVFCFGNCALGPTVEINGRISGRVTPQRFDALLDKA
ncbi:NAD(P)H-dependent oxidoreductase subunit E [Actinophytocola sp.]|uniref:NAD(P)H-dependent oxidoreductase subunit E n=1 Tax=Actinophytocola sp. TaxID=1872138 RepID=UPI002D6A70C9|nr:NAD(P)H-dependent oxidoreductase subunit E [Actinophytocola sp.]HYQ65791.1 NAD(P)H-dependent oxidoreductase subunit E [Actinophytocola sp.]